ncbi:MAG: Protease HtpX [Microgenomates bacterium OLB23]|nr:MAG: Protease HtpX [Microgenomates bacterium OLB23]
MVSTKGSRAFSLGFFHRKIYLSTSLVKKLSQQELEAVILHEYKHVRDFDSLRLFIAFAVESALLFIPSLKELTMFMRIDREVEADAFAVATQNTNRHILSSLKKFLSPDSMYASGFIPSFTPDNMFDARVSSLVKSHNMEKKPISLRRLLISVCSFLFLGYLALMPVHAAEMLINGKPGVVACTETSPLCLAVCENSSKLTY